MARKSKKSEQTSENCKVALPSYKVDIKCMNTKQKEYVKSIKNDKKEICFGIGSAGTGKTYLALATALSLLKDDLKYNSIVIFVPTCESTTKSLQIGFLKGELEEKIHVYCQNSINNIEKILTDSGNNNVKEIIDTLINKNFIRFELVNFIKGKTFSNCICIVEEAEDFAKDDMLLVLTRKGGFTCKMIISGDDKQISRVDLRNKIQNSGLRFSAQVLSDMEEVSVTEFTKEDIVRDKLLTEIITRFEGNNYNL